MYSIYLLLITYYLKLILVARIKVDLHNIYNNSKAIDKALHDAFEHAIFKKISEVEIIPGKGSGQSRNLIQIIVYK